MIAQFYIHDPEFVHVYDLQQELTWRQAIMDCAIHSSNPGLDSANAALRRCHLARIGPWKYFPAAGMYQAPVRFHRYQKKNNQLKK